MHHSSYGEGKDEATYPAAFLSELDRLMDQEASTDSALHLEEQVMSALFNFSIGQKEPLLEILERYPSLAAALSQCADSIGAA